jgi:hypothetical protein
MWHLPEWKYRNVQVLKPHKRAGKNFVFDIQILRSSGDNDPYNVYVDDKCKPDFSDIRFVDNHNRLLPYERIDYIEGGWAEFIVRFLGDLSKFPGIIYLYYGNPDAVYTGQTGLMYDYDVTFNSSVNLNKDWFIIKSSGASYQLLSDRLRISLNSDMDYIWFISKKSYGVGMLIISFSPSIFPFMYVGLVDKRCKLVRDYQGRLVPCPGYFERTYKKQTVRDYLKCVSLEYVLPDGSWNVEFTGTSRYPEIELPPVLYSSILWQDDYKICSGFFSQHTTPFKIPDKYKLVFGVTNMAGNIDVFTCQFQRQLYDYESLFVEPYWIFQERSNFYVEKKELIVKETIPQVLNQVSISNLLSVDDLLISRVLPSEKFWLNVNNIYFRRR